MNLDLRRLLEQELEILENAWKVLDYSYQKCQRIGLKEKYEPQELESFETLTSRFARLSDILTQKIFRLIDEIDLDSGGTVRDRIYRAEKKGLVENADSFIDIRILRNDITHEYKPEALEDIFNKVLSFTPILVDSVGRVRRYSQKLLNLR
ncbi:MAG: hypothetical protein HYS07_10815 [Chlamydiae bacterium]|nr:hypothetical protein [Chlamydiota bacterium]MBI3276937.1 hypothetical protein [Chlamydiota bacterium]